MFEKTKYTQSKKKILAYPISISFISFVIYSFVTDINLRIPCAPEINHLPSSEAGLFSLGMQMRFTVNKGRVSTLQDIRTT